MSVCIRLARFGRLHRPFYRIVAIDKRNAREGLNNEVVGTYDPLLKEKNISIDLEKVAAWVNKGAVISEALVSLLKHNGYTVPVTVRKAAKAKKPEAKRDGKKWVAPSRRALLNHKAKLKAVRKAELAKADAAKAAAKPAEGTEAPKA
jgi:small subunit ribosomal protein S16